MVRISIEHIHLEQEIVNKRSANLVNESDSCFFYGLPLIGCCLSLNK